MGLKGKDVTLIEKNGTRAVVVHVVSFGPVYIHARSYHMEDGVEELYPGAWKYERDHWHVLEGKHQDIRDRLAKAVSDNQDAREAHEQARNRAFWEFRDKWDLENQWPRLADVSELVPELKGAEAKP